MIIGFAGAAGSGKDSSAEALSDFKNLAFAKPLKDSCKILFNLTDPQLYDPKEKEEIILDSHGKSVWQIDEEEASPRLILQKVGTDYLRNHVSKNFFINHMNQRIEQSENKNITITDVRFPNELDYVKSKGGILIKVTRPLQETLTELTEHVTEQGLPDELFDHVVVNDGTLEDLHNKIKEILKPSLFDQKLKLFKSALIEDIVQTLTTDECENLSKRVQDYLNGVVSNRIRFISRMKRSYKVEIVGDVRYNNNRAPHVETDEEGLDNKEFELGTRRTTMVRGNMAVMYDIIGVKNKSSIAHMTVYFGPENEAHNY
jgi:hypothetical protein